MRAGAARRTAAPARRACARRRDGMRRARALGLGLPGQWPDGPPARRCARSQRAFASRRRTTTCRSTRRWMCPTCTCVAAAGARAAIVTHTVPWGFGSAPHATPPLRLSRRPRARAGDQADAVLQVQGVREGGVRVAPLLLVRASAPRARCAHAAAHTSARPAHPPTHHPLTRLPSSRAPSSRAAGT